MRHMLPTAVSTLPPQRVELGSILHRHGDPVREVVWLSSGLVKVSMDLANDVAIGCRGADSLLGAAEAIVRHPHRLTAIAAQPLEVRRLSVNQFYSLCDSDPEFRTFALTAISAE